MVASLRNVKVRGQIEVQFKNNDHIFQDTFLKLPSLNSVVLGKTFICKCSFEISPGENILKLSDMTDELNELKALNEGRKTIPKQR